MKIKSLIYGYENFKDTHFKKLLFLLLIPYSLFSYEYKIVTYNIQNLFDAKNNGNEYREYVPNAKSGWTKQMLDKKIKNIAKVIKEIDADIIVLQEVENLSVLKQLNLALGSKKYSFIYKPSKSIGIALLSRYKTKEINRYIIQNKSRPIYKVKVEKLNITLFLNHWPAYKHGNKSRMKYANKLLHIIKKKKSFILIGDFNAPFKVDKNGWGKSVEKLSKKSYDLWNEVPLKDRFSHAFFKNKNALDHIFISLNMKDKFKDFSVYKPKYLQNKYAQPKRWLISRKGKGKHLGVGFSDHYPIIAIFDTQVIEPKKPKDVSIKELKKINEERVNLILKDVMAIEITKYGVFLEDKTGDKIFSYEPTTKFELGKIYSLHVRQIADYKGKKEIVLSNINY